MSARPASSEGYGPPRVATTLAGAVQGLSMNLIDYVPCYRSEAGTGCAMAFAYWE